MRRYSVFTLLLAFTLTLLPLLASCKLLPNEDTGKTVISDGVLSYEVTDDTGKQCRVLGFAEEAATSVTIPNEVNGYAVTGIAPGAFSRLETLEQVTFPAGLQIVGDNAFYNCTALREIVLEEGLNRICWNAFYGCVNLRRVVLPASLERVDRDAFCNCKVLTTVEISDLEAWCRIDFELYHDEFNSNPLWYAKKLLLNGEPLTEAVLPDGLTEIGDSAFYGCETLERVSIPDSVTEIGKYAFARCTSLEEIVLPDHVRIVGERAFYDCSGLKTATLGNSLQTLDSFAFAECCELEEISVPGKVHELSQYVFASCSKLQIISLPATIEKINMGALRKCESLKEIRFAGTVAQWTAIDKVSFDRDSIYADLDWNYGWSYKMGADSVICSDGTTY